MLDITKEEIRGADKEDMLGVVSTFPQMFERAVGATEDLQVDLPRVPERILITAMGGSAISGTYLASLAERESRVPVLVNRDYSLPSWVDESTLVVAISYSGNTEETLAGFAEARERGAMLAAVATGGRLQKYAEKAGAPFVPVESGFQPRAAMPLLFVPAARLLELAQAMRTEEALRDTIRALKGMGDELLPDAPVAQNEAKRIAQAVHGTVPFTYGSEHLAPVAVRWQNEFNENSKILAHAAAMPEMNHNELVGWSKDEDLDRFTAIFLRHEGEHRQNRERLDFTARTIRERGGPVIQVSARGDTPMANMFTSTWVGSVASVYLAVRRGIDPTPVDIIHTLKERVGATGFVKELDAKF